MSDPREVLQQRALELQAAGPDEYPFGYYLNQAAEELDAESADQAVDITAGGSLHDGIFTITAELGNAKIVVTLPRADEEAYGQVDLLVAALPRAITEVCAAIIALVDEEEDRG